VKSSGSVPDSAYPRKWHVLISVSVALFMIMVDATVVNVSIPSISSGIGATFSDAEWVLNAYTLVFASLLVIFGRLGDMFGRKRFFLIGLTLFGLGSLACGLSGSPEVLIASRVGQAIGAAFMMPATLSLVAVNFPPGQRGIAMGVWGAVSGVATAVGPLLGGVLTDAFSWRYIFFINLPLVVLTLGYSLWAIPESRDENPHRVDVFGALLTIALLGSLCYGLIEGPDLGWADPTVLGLFGTAAVALIVLLLWERRAAEPILDIRLFRNRAFTAGTASGAVLMFGMMGMFFLLPVYLQASLGYSPVQTGLAITPMSFAIMFAAPMAGRLSDKIGSRWLIFSGMATAAVAVFWLSFLPNGAGWQWLCAPLVLAGIGMGLVMPPMTSAVMAVAPKGEEGAASGMLSTMRQVGGVFGVAVLGAIFSTSMIGAMVDAVPTISALPPSAVPYVASFIEDNNSAMSMATMAADEMRSVVPTEAMMPLITTAVTEAAEETLPEAMQQPVIEALVSYIEAGGSIEGTAAMEALAPLMGEMTGGAMGGDGAMPGTASDPSVFEDFGTSLGVKIEAGFVSIGEGFEGAVKDSFVVALSDTFRVASVVLAIGALLALLLKRGKNVESTLEALHVEPGDNHGKDA